MTKRVPGVIVNSAICVASIALLALALHVGLVHLYGKVPWKAVGDRLVREIAHAAGKEVTIEGISWDRSGVIQISGLEVSDLQEPEPPPLFTVQQIVLFVDLRAILIGAVAVEQLVLREPRLNVGGAGRRPEPSGRSWLPALAALPLELQVRKCRISRPAVTVRMEGDTAVEAALPDFTISGVAGRGRFVLHLGIPEEAEEASSFKVEIGPQERRTLVGIATADVRIDQLHNVSLAIRGKVGLREMDAEVGREIRPPDLSTNFDLILSDAAEALHVSSLVVAFGSANAIKLRGDVTGLRTEPKLNIELYETSVSLDEMSQYLAYVLPSLELSGAVEVPSWTIQGSPVRQISGAALTMIGSLALRGVNLLLPSADVEVQDAEARLKVEHLALVGWQPRQAVGAGDVSVGRARLRDIHLEGLNGFWEGKATGEALQEASILGSIEVSRIEAPLGPLGRVGASASARVELEGDLARGDLDSLKGNWQVGDVLKGEISGSLARFGEDGINLQGSFDGDLAALTALVTASAEKEMPVRSSGRVTGRLGAEGTLSRDVSAEPVNVSLDLRLEGVSLEGEGFALDGLSGEMGVLSGFFSPFTLAEPSWQGRLTAAELRARTFSAKDVLLDAEGSTQGLVGSGHASPFACSAQFSGDDFSLVGGAISARAVSANVTAGGVANLAGLTDLKVDANLDARNPSLGKRLMADRATVSGQFESAGPLNRATFPAFSSQGSWTIVGLAEAATGTQAGSMTGSFKAFGATDDEGVLSEVVLEEDANAREIVLGSGTSLAGVHVKVEAAVRGRLLHGESCDVKSVIQFSGDGAQSGGGEVRLGPLTGRFSVGGSYRLGDFLVDPAVEGAVSVAEFSLADLLSAGPAVLKMTAAGEGNVLERAPIRVHLAGEAEGLISPRLGAAAAAIQAEYDAEGILAAGKEAHELTITGHTSVDGLTMAGMAVEGQTSLDIEARAPEPIRMGGEGRVLCALRAAAPKLLYEKLSIVLEDVSGSIELPLQLGGDHGLGAAHMRGDISLGKIAVGEIAAVDQAGVEFEIENQGRFFEVVQVAAALGAGRIVLGRENFRAQDDGVVAEFSGTVNLPQRDVVAEELRLVAPQWFTVRASGRGNLVTRAVELEAQVTELDLARFLDALPVDAATLRPTVTLSEKPSLAVKVSGHLPLSTKEGELPIAVQVRYQMEGAELGWPGGSVAVDKLQADSRLRYASEGLAVEGSVTADVSSDVRAGDKGLGKLNLGYRLALDPKGRVTLEEAVVELPQQGLSLSAKGTADRGRAWSRKDLAGGIEHLFEVIRGDVSVVATLRAEDGKEVTPGLWAQGLAALDARAQWNPGEPVALEGELRLDGVSVKKGKAAEVEAINGRLPFAKAVAILAVPEGEGVDAGEPQGKKEFGGPGVLSFSALLRPYSQLQNVLTVAAVRAGGLAAEDIVADIQYRDNALLVPRFQAHVLDGVVAGHAFVGGPGKSQVVGAAFEFARINVKKLPGQFADVPDEAAEIGGNVSLALGLTARPDRPGIDIGSIDGEINITNIGERVVERLLVFLDPEESNPSIVDTRRRLKYAVPSKISASIQHGNLSLNLQLKAKALGGKTIEIPTIRRIPIHRLVRFSRVQDILERLEPVRVGLAALAANAIVKDEEGNWAFR